MSRRARWAVPSPYRRSHVPCLNDILILPKNCGICKFIAAFFENEKTPHLEMERPARVGTSGVVLPANSLGSARRVSRERSFLNHADSPE